MIDCNLTDGYGQCRECLYLEKEIDKLEAERDQWREKAIGISQDSNIEISCITEDRDAYKEQCERLADALEDSCYCDEGWYRSTEPCGNCEALAEYKKFKDERSNK